MEMINMAQERPTGEGMYATAPAMPMSNPYPYGLRLCLTMEELKKLGYDEMPPAGTELRLEAVACVVRCTSEDPDADGDCDYCSVELQVKELGIEEEDEADDDDDDEDGEGRAERMYGKGKQPA